MSAPITNNPAIINPIKEGLKYQMNNVGALVTTTMELWLSCDQGGQEDQRIIQNIQGLLVTYSRTL